MADQKDDEYLDVLVNTIRLEIRVNELEKILVALSRLEPTDAELDAIVGSIKRNRIT